MRFPVIEHISDIPKELLEQRWFAHVDRDSFQLINYIMMESDTFPDLDHKWGKYARELRGITFDKKGKLISRPYHKFFNWREREETRDLGAFGTPTILEKLDGSMIHPIWIEGNLRLATRGGISPVAMQAEKFLYSSELYHNYRSFLQLCEEVHLTPIFEWCSRKQRIVLDYPTDQLVLTAIRLKREGWYWKYKDLEWMSHRYNIPIVRSLSLEHDLEEIQKNDEGSEGLILRYDDGNMIKVKTEWYVTRHRAKDSVRFENECVLLILEDKLDDVIPLLSVEEVAEIEKLRDNLWDFIYDTEMNVLKLWEDFFKTHTLTEDNFREIKKAFSLEVASKAKTPLEKSCLFKLFELPKDHLREYIVNSVNSACHTNSKWLQWKKLNKV